MGNLSNYGKLGLSGFALILISISPCLSAAIGPDTYPVSVCVTNHTDYNTHFLLRYSAWDWGLCPVDDHNSDAIEPKKTLCFERKIDHECFARMDVRFFVDEPSETIWLTHHDHWIHMDNYETKSFTISSDPKECKGKSITNGKYCYFDN